MERKREREGERKGLLLRALGVLVGPGKEALPAGACAVSSWAVGEEELLGALCAVHPLGAACENNPSGIGTQLQVGHSPKC